MNGRKNAEEIRSFPMKIRQGRSEAVRPSLPFSSLPFRSRTSVLQVYVRGGEERIFLFSQRRPKSRSLSFRKRWSEHLEETANTREITLILRVARRSVGHDEVVVICR